MCKACKCAFFIGGKFSRKNDISIKIRDFDEVNRKVFLAIKKTAGPEKTCAIFYDSLLI